MPLRARSAGSACVYENYKLALTDGLLNAVFASGRLDQPVPTAAARAADLLDDSRTSGYLGGTDATGLFGAQAAGPVLDALGRRGLRAGRADRHFYLPERYTDPFQRPTNSSTTRS